jgi:hypothetical protein
VTFARHESAVQTVFRSAIADQPTRWEAREMKDEASPRRRGPERRRLERPAENEVVVSRGVIRDGQLPVEYHTSQPSPSQWIALGVVQESTPVDVESTHRLMVGTGETEEAAIEALRLRVVSVLAPKSDHQPMTIVEVASPSQASDWFGN